MSEAVRDLPRYADWYRSQYEPLAIEERSAGRIGATLLYARQQAGDWSDAETSDLTVSMCYEGGVPFELAVTGERGLAADTLPRSFITVSPGVSGRFIQKAEMTSVLIAIPAAELKGYADFGDTTSLLDFSPLHAPAEDMEVVRLLESFWHATRAGSIGGHLQADGYVLHILAALVRMRDGRTKPRRGGLAGWQMRRCAEMLADPDAGYLSLRDLADMVGLSTFHFCRAFKDSFGMPPFRYQMLKRLERARQLLERTDETVTDVALTVGYVSSQALARVFRRELGLSPSEYRQLVRT